jgi:hypothetical protein
MFHLDALISVDHRDPPLVWRIPVRLFEVKKSRSSNIVA